MSTAIHTFRIKSQSGETLIQTVVGDAAAIEYRLEASQAGVEFTHSSPWGHVGYQKRDVDTAVRDALDWMKRT